MPALNVTDSEIAHMARLLEEAIAKAKEAA
jgi:hypothetical protein